MVNLETCRVERVSDSGSHPWGIRHLPTGKLVSVRHEVAPGFEVDALYFRRKRDAVAGLAARIAAEISPPSAATV